RGTLAASAARLRTRPPAGARDDCGLEGAAVESADSSALALVFGLQRAAAAAGRQLTLTALPNGLATLAQLYGVEHFVSQAD
ncbi:STAS domain-containing protein, partial [Microvirgula aerodenitrificans]|uniref:STAS domain-containing protein n=1 Tax=Microvirgula aerodenitrificans TaxID=57480 RepID=UPI00248E4420